jgi:hypothetical protein
MAMMPYIPAILLNRANKVMIVQPTFKSRMNRKDVRLVWKLGIRNHILDILAERTALVDAKRKRDGGI